MAERGGKMPASSAGYKPMPMKLFAAWEVDRTPPNCVPRLCSLTINRLVILKPMGPDLTSVVLAVKMESTKRTLRSNDIPLPPNGLLDTELELSFALQYPHYLKQDCNKLHVILQRRKRYKNRTILGFKSLAAGVINMAQALQRQTDLELELHSELKEKGGLSLIARVSIQGLSSQPVDNEEGGDRPKALSLGLGDNPDRHVGVADFRYSDEEDDSSNDDEGSDSETMMMEERLDRVDRRPRPRKSSRTKILSLPPNARQRNLKQKFIALLKRFKITEDLQGLAQGSGALDPKLAGGDIGMDPGDIEDLFDELEDLSDSGPEMDTLSVTSTPKPSLRPFFASSRSLIHESLPLPRVVEKNDRLSDESSKKADSDSHAEGLTDQEQSDPTYPLHPVSPPVAKPQEDKTKSSESRRSRLFSRGDKTFSSMRENKDKKDKEKESKLEKDTKEKNVDSKTTTATLHAHLEKMPSLLLDTSPRKLLLEQLSKCLQPDDLLPDHILLVNGAEPVGAALACRLQDRHPRLIWTQSGADVRASITCIVNKIQKFCNSNAKPPPPIKVVLAGSDQFINSVLRPYVDQFSSKPPEWQNYLRFLILPLGNSVLGRYLCSLDRIYHANFGECWRELMERGLGGSDGVQSPTIQGFSYKADTQEILNRLQRYIHGSAGTLQVPIAEAMVTYKDTTSEDESTQAFIPFITEVRIGACDITSGSMDVEDGQCQSNVGFPSGSPPSQTLTLPMLGDKEKDKDKDKKERITPPNSPNISSFNARESVGSLSAEPFELQLDYWLGAGSKTDGLSAGGVVSGVSNALKSRSETGKCTLKSGFRFVNIQRLASLGDAPSHHFSMHFALKEKKQKSDILMRLGKKKEKEKDTDMKNQIVEGICRLICLAKTHHNLLKVTIDGTEWHNVKFFQLSAQWQTHIKFFPVALFCGTDPTP